MSYFYIHEHGYKFADKIQNLTQPQLVFLGKASEISAQRKKDGDNSTQETLRDKVRQRRQKK